MGFKTEELKAQGFTDEQCAWLHTEFGKEFNPVKAERDSYKTQYETAQTTLKSFEGIDIKDLQGKITQLTNDLATKDSEIANVRSEAVFHEALKEAIRSAGARSDKAVLPFLDVESLKKSKNQDVDLKAAIEAVKKGNDYLFQPEKPFQRSTSATPGMVNEQVSKTAAANDALRSLLGAAD